MSAWVYSPRHRCYLLPRSARLPRRQRRIARDLARTAWSVIA